MSEGLFISVEGLDGAGTTTASNAIVEHFDDTVLTREPTSEWTGKQVRRCISSESNTSPLTDFYFFMGDRVHHIENTIKPAVKDGKLVVSDRYSDSTLAYQTITLEDAGMKRGRIMPYIETVMQPFFYEPDLTLWLDVDVHTAFERTSGGEKYEESCDFQERVKYNYEQLYNEEERIVQIDANQRLSGVVTDCIQEIERLK
jgi:dTMP kinase